MPFQTLISGALRAICLATALAPPAQAQESATAQAPARISVAVPQGGAGQVMLDLVVTAFKAPDSGNVGGVVALKRPGEGRAVEVGRFSIFPQESFTALGADDARRFQFNVTNAWKDLGLAGANAPGQVEVEVALVNRTGGSVPAGATLTVGDAQIATR